MTEVAPNVSKPKPSVNTDLLSLHHLNVGIDRGALSPEGIVVAYRDALELRAEEWMKLGFFRESPVHHSSSATSYGSSSCKTNAV